MLKQRFAAQYYLEKSSSEDSFLGINLDNYCSLTDAVAAEWKHINHRNNPMQIIVPMKTMQPIKKLKKSEKST